MSEPRNSPLSVFYTGESNIPRLEENLSCQDALEPVCGNSKSVRILKEFRHIYEERLRNIDEEASGEGMELKLKTLTSWVNDLGEQNLMLVETVEQLEREAADRVALLEERLKKSSHIALEYMSKLEEYDHQFLDVSEGRAPSVVLPIRTSSRLVQAQQTEEILKTRVGNLQNDISGLLELIRRARCEGTWDTNGLSFLEVTYEDIFASYPHQVSDNLETLGLMQTTVKMLQQKLVKALEDYHGRDHEVKLLREQVACQQTDIAFKDVQIKNFAEKIQELQSSNCGRPQEEIHDAGKSFVVDAAVMTSMNNGELEITSCNQRTVGSGTEELEVSVLTKKLDDTNFHLQTILQENERLVKEIGVLTSDLKIKTDKIDALSQNLTHVDKSEVESRVTDLEVTYSRLERSFKAAWEASKVKSMNDLIYRQNALEEKNPGGVKSCTFDISEKMPWCTPDVIKDQERIREICDNIKMILHPQQHCIVKKGVSFASPTKEEYKLQVQELQKALKQAQNGAEVARKQIRKNNECLYDEGQYARQVEEFRVNVVLAQAAIEETVEELETLADNLQGREEKVHQLEVLIRILQNSLMLSLQDIIDLLKPVINDENMIDDGSGLFLSYLTKVQTICQLLKSLRNESTSSCDGLTGDLPPRTVLEYGNIPQSSSLKEINMLVEELSQQEVENSVFQMSQRYLEIKAFQTKLHGFYSEIKEAQERIDDYVQDIETSHNSRLQNEQKIKKLQLELESVQEDLEQCLKKFEPNDMSESDIE